VIAALALAAAADACALLSAADIRRVQGQEPKETKASERRLGELSLQQCFYALPDFSRSISLEVTRGARARDLWKARFREREVDQDERDKKRDREEDEDERDKKRDREEEENRPERVRGVGEEAFWSGGLRLGGLYVLRKNAILRLSVGGNEPKAKKLRRLIALARSALRRL
jgi:hypothetical protein